MSELKRRIDRLERRAGRRPRELRGMSDDELAAIITGNPDAKDGDVTDAMLEAFIAEGRRDEHESQETVAHGNSESTN